MVLTGELKRISLTNQGLAHSSSFFDRAYCAAYMISQKNPAVSATRMKISQSSIVQPVSSPSHAGYSPRVSTSRRRIW